MLSIEGTDVLIALGVTAPLTTSGSGTAVASAAGTWPAATGTRPTGTWASGTSSAPVVAAVTSIATGTVGTGDP